MSKVEWFSARELADLKLPAIAGFFTKIIDQANREGWTFRPRAGRGGGREYYIGSLPEAARMELARRAVDEIHSLPSSPSDGCVASRTNSSLSGNSLPLSRLAPQGERGGKVYLSATKPGTRSQARGAARMSVVNMLKTFAEAGGLSMVAARAGFARLFNEGAIAAEPWVKAEVGMLTVRSLERWSSQAARHGAQRLGGNYGHRKGKGQIEGNPILRDFAITQMAARPHLTSQQLVDFLRAAHQVEIPRRTVQRFMSTARVHYANAFLAAANPDAWKNKRLVAFGSQSEGATGPNAVWEIDASPADVLVLDPETGKPRRLTLVGLIDVWSRRAKVLVTETPRATAATLLLRKAIVHWGVPAVLKTDNGKDFASAHMARALGAMMIEQKLCPPFTPEGKPHIERFFGTLQRDCIALLPGFIGHNVADRKAIEARRSFADRFGDGDQLIEVSMSRDELQQKIDDWVEHSYHRQKHAGIGTTPMLRLMEWTGILARIENERALDVLLAEAPDTDGLRVVTKKGLRVENANFIARELAHHVGERVQVRLDPEDMGRIVIYSLEGDFICVAECPERTGANRQEIAAIAKAEQRQVQRDLRAAQKANAREHRPHEIVDAVMAMKRGDANQVVTFTGADARNTAHETPALSAAAIAARRLAGERDAPTPLTDEERELAAETMEALQADVIPLTPRAPVSEEPIDDFEWMLWARANAARLTPVQAEMLAEFERSPAMKMRLQHMRGGNRA